MGEATQADIFFKDGAQLSGDRKHRLSLYRFWDDSLNFCMFIMLNPSTADETKNDPTIRRCIAFARSWGFGGIFIHNLYSLRATDPATLAASPDPALHSLHDRLMGSNLVLSSLVVAAWGSHQFIRPERVEAVVEVVRAHNRPLHVLKLNQDGSPAHPLYQPAATKPIFWRA